MEINDPPPPESRSQPRIRGRLPVRFGAETTSIEATTGNISEGGAFLRTTAPLDPGTPIQMRIEFPSGLVWQRGRVVWARPSDAVAASRYEPGMGVQFLDTGSAWWSFFREWRLTVMLDAD